MDAVEDVIDELYRVAPEDFVAERDARVAAAKEAGDKDSAKVIGAARRPSRAAWLTNLLVHDRPDEVEGLLGLADTLASAQRTLDGAALRAVSAQRNKLVGALSRRAAQLGRDGGHRVDSSLERDVRGILEAALADPELADRVRTGRLEKAERHAGFGPEPAAGAEPRPADGRAGGGAARNGSAARTTGAGGALPADADHERPSAGTSGSGEDDEAGHGREARREAERREREIARAREALDTAERAARARIEEHEHARDQAADATDRQDRARDRVAELTDELDRARDESAAANRAAHAASSTEREAARAARTAETARDRAAAALEELSPRSS